MREMLFKAKLRGIDTWAEGYYVCLNDNNGNVLHRIYTGHAGVGRFGYYYPDYCEVDPKTVCQYTGLKDKNGVKIFEGDILKQKTTECFKEYSDFEWELYGIVRYGEYDWNESEAGCYSMGYFIEPTESISINPSDYLAGPIQAGLNQQDINSACYPFEVIGNIHDKEAGNGT